MNRLSYIVLAILAVVVLSSYYSDTSYKKVGKGESYDNGDVQVKNSSKKAVMRVDPIVAENNDTHSTVDCSNDCEGEVKGLESGDTVNATSGNKLKVSGVGGTVNVSGSGSEVEVTNTSSAGGDNMTVNGPGGTSVSIPPGNTATIKT